MPHVERSGGLSRFSDAMYKLAEWLDATAVRSVSTPSTGASQKNVQILTQGE